MSSRAVSEAMNIRLVDVCTFAVCGLREIAADALVMITGWLANESLTSELVGRRGKRQAAGVISATTIGDAHPPAAIHRMFRCVPAGHCVGVSLCGTANAFDEIPSLTYGAFPVL